MGADFIFSYLATDPGREIDYPAGRRAIEGLARRPLEEWPPELLDYAGADPSADEDRTETRARLVEQLTADVVVLEAAVSGRRRDVWVGEIGSKWVALTGGMSWGDAPTDALEAFERLAAAGISRAMGFDW